MNTTKYKEAERKLWAHVGLSPKDRYIDLAVTGTRVRVQEIGEGEPVLFIHGGPNSGSTWAPMLPFVRNVRCLLVDRPGTGLSEAADVSHQTLPELGARFVGDVLDGLGLSDAHVVASSFGGHLALRSAAHRPESFRRMVQMAAPAMVPEQSFPPFMKQITNGFIRWLITHLPPMKKANLDIMRQIGHGASLDAGRIPDIFFDWYMALGRHTDTMKNDLNMIGRYCLPHLEELTLRENLLAEVQMPTLFLWGADDGFGREDNAHLVTGMIPGAELEMIPEAGHLPWLDFPEEIGKRTLAFLEGHSAMAAAQ